jgi:thiamine biosynthesis protein ThiS
MKRIILNGKTQETGAEDVAGLVAELGFAKGTVLVEMNGVALRGEEWGRTLGDGDKVELMKIVAGG